MRTVIYNAKVLAEDPENYDARAQVMWAGSLSHNGLTGCGTEGDWASHQLEHELGGMFDVAHGAGLAAVWEAGHAMYTKKNRHVLHSLQPMCSTFPGTAAIWSRWRWTGFRQWKHFTAASICQPAWQSLAHIPTEEQIQELAKKCSFMGKPDRRNL